MKGAGPTASSNRTVGIVDPGEIALLEAAHLTYGLEIARLKMQLVKYREALLDAGIEPPDAEGEDLMRMWESCRAVISAAHLALSELGTSKELLYPLRKP